ncbi:MAG: hypothetical protein O3A92_07560 [Verrucomicrobia bacterium]|nr:hypothetical protein [Verrucomicrobiota bacterium]
MMSATTQAIKDRWNDEPLIATKKFTRVALEDSSQARTDKRNAEDFPGHGFLHPDTGRFRDRAAQHVEILESIPRPSESPRGSGNRSGLF